ncbi:DeoR/GlpR family DNA-binding transcription regulator [Cohaesibacter sp. CAU 1516]|uniref:DeoR/GlpR family DNA-binding transcription regulator n=1 Tax=Cohaesibacter sp. CAU 1516 TaxID=2576038 RepID=UPI001484D4EE|nr:DeoR/GlpR family DNA-binding transcription regulator [Cohaesibacter sp. CAU 1516]
MLPGRLKDIVNRVDHLGSISVADLSAQFGVAVETIRRDLRLLEEQGYLRRTHGGASSLLDSHDVLAFGSRQSLNSDAKEAMARHALPFIHEEQTLMLDPSSSCWYLARMLPDMPLTVITNSLRIVFDLVHKPNIRVIGVGGRYYEKYGAFLGTITVDHIHEFQADLCFHSCAGFMDESGAWDSNALNAGVKRAMRRSSRDHIMLCDKSKEERGGFMQIANAERIHCRINEDGVVGAMPQG